ncbi:MAG: diaminopimelate epimerase [Candidatus Aminicenantes bacterium]|jgi:diaminopimelate epimerase
MIFYKTVSCGNDFILIDRDEYQSAAAAVISKGQLAKKICCRHNGAGADGVVYYKIFPDTMPVDFEIFNRDGSEAELSGNGMAGLSALFFYLRQPGNRDDVVLNTKAGPKRNTCLQREKNRFRLKIEMGTANFQDHDFFPFLKSLKKEQTSEMTPVKERHQADREWVGGATPYRYNGITFYPVSVGNPHAVILVEEDISADKPGQIGQMLVGAPIFPYKTNVELVLPTGREPVDYEKGENFRVFFYERGVGQTRSSSTGSAAVFAVLQKLNLITHTLTIPYPDETIKISGKNKIYIENYTEIVYKGVYLS